MSQNLIKTFRLNYDGTFEEIDYHNIKDVFTIVNILAIYIQKKRIMYVWIGKSATQALKNHIVKIRVLLKDKFPQFRILRNITFEMRSEPYDFFENLNIDKEELYAHINHQEKVVLPIIEKIDELKTKAEKLIKSQEFDKAVVNLEEVIVFAQKIKDEATIREQRKRISDLTQQGDDKKIISKIEEAALKAEKEYTNLLGENDIVGAYKVVESFENSFETTYDLSLILSAKNLISKAKKKWNSEKAKLETDLFKLGKDFINSVDIMEYDKAFEIFKTGKKILSPLIDDKIRNNWEGFENKLQELKLNVDLVEKFENLSKDSIQLKKEHQYKEINSRIKKLIKEFQEVDLPEYQSKLDLLQKDIAYAEEFYHKTLGSIEELEKKTEEDKKSSKLDDVVKDCLSLIGFAKEIDLFSTVDRFELILEETKKEIKERQKREEEQQKLKINLSKLEKNLESSIKSLKLTKAKEILEKGKLMSSNVVDVEVRLHWDDLEKVYKKAEKKRDLMSEIDEFLSEIVALKEDFKFEILKSKLETLIAKTKEKNIPEYLEKLEKSKNEVDSSEASFNNTLTEIIELGEKIKSNQEEKLLDETLKHCETLIGLAKSINQVEFIEKYSEVKSTLIQQIEERKGFEEKQQKLKNDLSKLEKDLEPSFHKMELDKISKILEKGKIFLSELVDQTIKKKWDDFEFNFVNAKQLLNNIESLSESGMESLIKGSCSESLECFKQIIIQLQEYEIGE